MSCSRLKQSEKRKSFGTRRIVLLLHICWPGPAGMLETIWIHLVYFLLFSVRNCFRPYQLCQPPWTIQPLAWAKWSWQIQIEVFPYHVYPIYYGWNAVYIYITSISNVLRTNRCRLFCWKHFARWVDAKGWQMLKYCPWKITVQIQGTVLAWHAVSISRQELPSISVREQYYILLHIYFIIDYLGFCLRSTDPFHGIPVYLTRTPLLLSTVLIKTFCFIYTPV